jgi:hypothetical protein
MSWNIETTDEFRAWWSVLNEREREVIFAAVTILEERGPSLGRPWVDTLAKDSKHANMKELRVQCKGKPYRILFAFDPRQTGILLIGGRKSGKTWTSDIVAVADKIYGAYLNEIRREGLIE